MISLDISANILLTGGTGFFGRALLRHWQEKFEAGASIPNVLILSRSPNKFLSQFPEFAKLKWLEFHCGDIDSYESLPKTREFSHIIHTAADSTNGPQLLPLQRFDQILTGTRNILDLAINTKAKRFLFVSSGAVYGTQPEDLDAIPEDYLGGPDPLNPMNAYGIAKRSAEHICSLYSKQFGIEIIVARCFAFVGEDLPLDAHFAIGNFIRDAIYRDEIVVRSDGTSIRSYLDQRDLASWLIALLVSAPANSAFNVGAADSISIRNLAILIRDLIAPQKTIRFEYPNNGTNKIHRYIPDINKLIKLLNPSPKISLEQSILDLANKLNR